MTPDLQEVAECCDRLLKRVKDSEVLICYDIGTFVNLVRGDRAKYGNSAREQLCMYLDIKRSTLCDFGTFAKAFERKLVEAWMGQESRVRGFSLGICHWMEIARARSDAQRTVLLKRTLKEGLSVPELKEAMDSEGIPFSSEPSTGRHRLLPPAPATLLGKMTDFARRVALFEQKIVKPLVRTLQKCSSNQIDDRMVKSCLQADQQLEEMIERLKSIRGEWKATMERVNRVMAKKLSARGSPSE
jgi:hypothetical protein